MVSAVFSSSNGPGTAVLVAFGGTLLVVAVLGDRVESMEFGGSKIMLRAAAAGKYAQAEVSESAGWRFRLDSGRRRLSDRILARI